MDRSMRVLDLFSGIGGFSLGLERAGMTTVAFCEIDPYCRKVLRRHWPDVPIHEDIKKLRGSDVGAVDLICGGFPCQPFSSAGKQAGTEDDRHLWPEMYRMVKELRPTWIIGENVAGFVSVGLDLVLSDLEKAGYSARAFMVPAVAVDAKHRRDRFWIVGHSNRYSKPDGTINDEASRLQALVGDADISNAEHTIREVQNVQRTDSIRIYKDGHKFSEWPIEPGVGRVAHGVPNRVDRLGGLGNAVVPQIPEMIGNAIMAVQESMEVT